MSENFAFDVFLSHSTGDKEIVRPIAERLRQDGLKVWFDEWEIKPGDSIPAKIEEGLEHSRVLVLCMSANAFGSDWAKLEAGTFRFRDPLNKERRFISLRLDDAPIRGSLAQFLYIDWRPADRQQAYGQILEACRPLPRLVGAPAARSLSAKKVIQLDYKQVSVYAFDSDPKRALTGSRDGCLRLWDFETGHSLQTIKAHTDEINSGSLAWAPNQRRVLTGSDDKTMRLWDLETGNCLRVFKGHTHRVRGIAISADWRQALSASEDTTLRLWDVETGRCLHVFKGHASEVWRVSWTAQVNCIVSSSADNTVRLWNLRTGRCSRVLEGHTKGIWALAPSPVSAHVASGASDASIRIWDLETGRCQGILEGHGKHVTCLTWSSDQRHLLSGYGDGTVCLWDMQSLNCLGVLLGHGGTVKKIMWSPDGRRAYSGDEMGGIRVWDLSVFVAEAQAPKAIVPKLALATEQIQYTNAKVLLVGESGVGKTGLSNYLAHGIKVEDNKSLPSTDGTWATHWPLKHEKNKAGVEREIWLWDFAGQVDYRLVHQLHMEDAAAAVVVFDPQKEDLFEGLGRWDHDIQKATRKPLAKLLAAGRVDRGGLVVSAATMKKFMMERGFRDPLHVTSAKTGEGCDALREAIVEAIDWQSIPETTSPALYHRLKQEILTLRDSGMVLIRLAELKQRMEMTLLQEHFELAELEAVVSLLAGPGMIQRLDFGDFILLRPDVLSRYAAAVVRKVRKHPQEMGCIREDELLAGELDYQDFQRLPRDTEKVILECLLERFIRNAWCLRQKHDGTAILTFPSYFRRERDKQPDHPNVVVTYRFDGPVDEVYATLVVRLHHTDAFQTDQLWKDAADFKTQTGNRLGLTLTKEKEGGGLLDVYFAPEVQTDSRLLFLRYVHDHLGQIAQTVVRLRHYGCGNKKCKDFEKPFKDREAIDEALAPDGEGKVFCAKCGKPIHLRDVIEEKFESPKVKAQVRQMQIESQIVIDSESKELILVGHAFSIVAEAGQIYRGYTNSDHGIDGEVEFKDDQGRASGKRLYLQLKSGDSYSTKRRRDGAEVFHIKNPRWADYWQQQAYAVMLVIRTSDGEIRWMDVSTYLKAASASGKTVKQIVFAGERFDALSVQNWRKKLLSEEVLA